MVRKGNLMGRQIPTRRESSRNLVQRSLEEVKPNGATNARKSTMENVTEKSLVSNVESQSTTPATAQPIKGCAMDATKKGTF